MSDICYFPFTLTLGAKVRLSRVARRWRQIDLANEALVTQADVSALERGKYVCPLVEKRILESLGLVGDAITHYQKLVATLLRSPKRRREFEKRLTYLQKGDGSGSTGK